MPLFRWRFVFILFCAAGFLPALLSAQTRSNFASSITSESMAAVWVAKERGLFKKYGLDVQYILMPRSPLAVAALVAGEIDVAVIGPGHLVNAATGGTDVVGIANFAQKLDYRLNTRPEIKTKKSCAVSGSRSAAPGQPPILFHYWLCSIWRSIPMEPRSLFSRFREPRSIAG